MFPLFMQTYNKTCVHIELIELKGHKCREFNENGRRIFTIQSKLFRFK